VIGELSRDHLRPGALASNPVVVAGELECRLDRLGATRREEDPVEVPGRELRDPCRQLDGTRVCVAPVGVERELLRLRCGSLRELLAPVAGVHAEQRGKPVEVAAAVLVPHVAAFAADDDRHVLAVVGAHPREVHPEMAPREFLKPAARGLHSRASL
jgi:hypothetical protein